MIIIGVFGYHIIEGWSFLDSFYMTVITIFTVGFREVRTLTPQGQLFTIFIILGGVGTAIFAFTKLGEIIFEGGVREFLRRKKMENKIKNLKDHYIICGHGRMGETVREKLQEENVSFIIIDFKKECLENLKGSNSCPYILGDATQEEVLIKAGIKRAKGIATLLSSDADNLYLTLTAKLINPSLFVLSRVLEDEAEKKILQIGASKVLRPYKESGLKIAQALIRPTLVDFMDLIIRRKEISLVMEELVAKKNAKLVGKSLKDYNIRSTANVIVVAIKKPGEDIEFNPSPDVKIQTGDTLLVMGDKEDLKRFENIYLEAGK